MTAVFLQRGTSDLQWIMSNDGYLSREFYQEQRRFFPDFLGKKAFPLKTHLIKPYARHA